MTDKIEGSKYVSLHFVWPIHLQLFGLLAVSEDDQLKELSGEYSMIASMKSIGRAYMIKNANDMDPQFEHKAMTVLNPMMKKLKNISNRQELDDQIANYLDTHFPVNTEAIQVETNLPSVSTEKTNFLENFVSFDDFGSAQPQQTEFSQYVNHPITCSVDVVNWWNEHATIYPRLFKIFMKLSCIPGSSGSSERTFSLAGNIVTDKRSLILPENVDNLIVARNAFV